MCRSIRFGSSLTRWTKTNTISYGSINNTSPPPVIVAKSESTAAASTTITSDRRLLLDHEPKTLQDIQLAVNSLIVSVEKKDHTTRGYKAMMLEPVFTEPELEIIDDALRFTHACLDRVGNIV